VVRSRDQICYFTSPFIFATVDGRVFKFYTELTRQNYNNIYIEEPLQWIVEWLNFATALCLRVLQIYMIILACTRFLALCLYNEHVYVNCYMRHWTDSVFVRTLSCCIYFRFYVAGLILTLNVTGFATASIVERYKLHRCDIFSERCTYCKARYCYRKSSVRLSVCLYRWWIVSI